MPMRCALCCWPSGRAMARSASGGWQSSPSCSAIASGGRSERLDPDQLGSLTLERRGADARGGRRRGGEGQTPPVKPAAAPKRQVNRGALPLHLPREEIVIDVADKTCACCGGLKHRIGEDVAERLDVVPAQFRVVVTRRPKYACASLHRRGRAGAGAGAADRGRHSDRGAGRAGAGGQVRRSSAAVPPGADLRPPRRRRSIAPPWPIGSAAPPSGCGRCTRGCWSS